MEHELGDFTFLVPDEWRDRTSYSFASIDERASLIVEHATEILDEARILEKVRGGFLSIWRPAVIYVNDTSFRRRGRARSPGIEGGQRTMVATAPPIRFAKVAVATATRSLALHFLGPSTRDFLPFVQGIVGTVTREDETPAIVPDGCVRVQASSIHLCVPRAWTLPLTRSFLGADSDLVRIDAVFGDTLPVRGSTDFGQTILGPYKIIEERPADIARPPLAGWSAEWVLEHELHPLRRIARKASVSAPSGRTLTFVGCAPQSASAALDRGWHIATSTLALAPQQENHRG